MLAIATVSPLFTVILRSYHILLVPYVPVHSLPFLQGFDTKITTVVARIHAEGDGSCFWCLTPPFNITAKFWMNLQKTYELRLAEQALPVEVGSISSNGEKPLPRLKAFRIHSGSKAGRNRLTSRKSNYSASVFCVAQHDCISAPTHIVSRAATPRDSGVLRKSGEPRGA